MPVAASYFDPRNDEPTLWLDDTIFADRKALLDQLSQAIATCAPPQVFGVHGDWGSGKTSFLHRLFAQLTGECPQNREFDDWLKKQNPKPTGFTNVTGIWFEAWRYQHETAPVVALLHELRAQLERKKSFLAKLITELDATADKSMEAALLALEDLTAKLSFKLGPVSFEVGGKGPRSNAVFDKWERENLSAQLPSHHIRGHLESVLDALLPGKQLTDQRGTHPLRLVIFIDDLDRCQPDCAFRLLEAVKIYLNLRNCVFVLGLNQREIQRAIAQALPKGGSETSESDTVLIRAHEYIEKLCGNIVRLPLLTAAQQRALLAEWLDGVKPANIITALLDLLDESKGGHAFLPANPRRIKAFANSVRRLLHRRREPKTATSAENEARALAITASLYNFHPELYARLEKDTASFIEKLRDFCIRDFDHPGKEHDDRHPPDGDPSFRYPIFRELRRPWSIIKDAKAGTFQAASLHADAHSLDVLHCQRLIAESTDARAPLLEHYLGK
jgi:hypothetical protein